VARHPDHAQQRDGDVLAHPIYIDRGTHATTPPLSRAIIIDGWERRFSSLDTGIYDIKVGSSGGVDNLSIFGGNDASLNGYKIDLNSTPNTKLYGVGANWTTDNKHASTIAIRSNLGGVLADITFGTDVVIAKPSANNLKITANTAIEITGDVNISGSGKGMKFGSSGDVLGAYAEAETFTPTLTCTTPGDLAVTYAVRTGYYQRVGNMIRARVKIATSVFTHTTAAGQFSISGLPVAAVLSATVYTKMDRYQGITKANYTDFSVGLANGGTSVSLWASGSGQTFATVATGDVPTAGAVIVDFEIWYPVA
jgi:hypothetical protein